MELMNLMLINTGVFSFTLIVMLIIFFVKPRKSNGENGELNKIKEQVNGE